jgi:hypothetical protein
VVKLAQILVVAVIAAGWTRIIAAQPPLPHQPGELQILENNAAQPPGMGNDWRRFGSGLEDDHPSAARVRFVTSSEDSHPIVSAVRFGSGLEDDAPVRPPNVFHLSGLEGLTSIQTPHPNKLAVRFGSGLEDDHPVAARVRFGSGLEDDAPVRSPRVIYQPGF